MRYLFGLHSTGTKYASVSSVHLVHSSWGHLGITIVLRAIFSGELGQDPLMVLSLTTYLQYSTLLRRVAYCTPCGHEIHSPPPLRWQMNDLPTLGAMLRLTRDRACQWFRDFHLISISTPDVVCAGP